MPLYEYRCDDGHVTKRIRAWEDRDAPVECAECGADTEFVFPLPHVGPDGVYSYAPNIGSKDAFDRKEWIIQERKAAKEEGRKPKV